MAKNSKSNLERIFRKSKVIIENVSPDSFGLDETIEQSLKDFAIIIPKMNAPCILVNETSKRADTYFPRAFKRKLSTYGRKDTMGIIGQYREALNTLRRHNYTIKLSKFLGPWDNKN